MEEKAVNNEYVDNALKSVSDEILAKKKRKRLITFSIISFICLALVITITTMSVAQTNTKPYFIKPQNTIEVTISGTPTLYEKSRNEDEYNKINATINSSFTTNYLSALFAGETSAYKIEEDKHKNEKFYQSIAGGVGSGKSGTLTNYLGNNYVHFQYSELQTLYLANGREYKSVVVSGSKTIEYKDVYFTISTTDGWSETTFYFGACTNRTNALLSITVSANTYPIYELVSGLQK